MDRLSLSRHGESFPKEPFGLAWLTRGPCGLWSTWLGLLLPSLLHSGFVWASPQCLHLCL